MNHFKGLFLAGALLVGTAGASSAQVAVSVGNPYIGQGVYVGTPGYGYGGFNNYYGPGYLGSPRAFGYSSGYAGYAAPAVGVGAVGYGYQPYYGTYGYSSYGYRNYGGFRPFRGIGRRGW